MVRGNGQSAAISIAIEAANIATYALQVVQSVELRTQATMYTQELLVHDSRQGQGAERVHACFIHGFRVLVLALELECEVVSQVSALVVAAQQPERVGVPDLQRPQVQDTLPTSAIASFPRAILHTSILK